MPSVADLIFSSPAIGLPVTLGNLAIWLGLASAITCVVLYWAAMIRTMRRPAEAVESAIETNGGKGGRKSGARSGANGASQSPYDEKTERVGLWARRFFFITSGLVALGAVCLMFLVLNQTYTVQYVWKNSNPELPFGYRFASFWADQEGTFFLWGLYNVIFGSIFLWKAREDERWVMPFFTMIQISLFTLLVFMNPFWLPEPKMVRELLEGAKAPQEFFGFLPDTFGERVAYYLGWGQYIRQEHVTPRGLNEQLQNPWMVIHPPTLFVGYAGMMIPASFALGAMMRRDYDGWITRAAPWLMFSWAVLGTGIFMGAYWAYETLGWGGYWSWDPVENSSILPWLGGTALIHGLLAQRNRGNFKQANLFLGLLCGVFVLLGSFLVRSGVLGEVSVHSFATPQKSVFNTLLTVLIVWTVLSVGIWFWRFKDIQAEIAYERVWERHFGFFLGLIVLTATSVVITVGVFVMPVLVPLITRQKPTLDHTFYNKALLPVCFVMVLLMAITPLMPWKQSGTRRPLKPFTLVTLIISGLITVYFVGAGLYALQGGFKTQNDPAYLGFGLIVIMAVITNLVAMARAVRGGVLNAGPWLAHVGFLVFLGGVLVSTRFKEVTTIQKLEVGQSQVVAGRTFTFRGQREAANERDRDRLLIDMKEKDGKVVNLAPKLFISKQTKQTMAWPQIVRAGVSDIYVEPSGMDTSNVVALAEVEKGQPKGVIIQHRSTDPEDKVLFQFNGLDMSEMQAMLQGGVDPNKPVKIYADAVALINGVEKKYRVGAELNLEALMMVSQGQTDEEATPILMNPESVPVEGLSQSTRYSLRLSNAHLSPANPKAHFEFVPENPIPQAYFQVIRVPGIHVVWWGAYIFILGAFMTYRRRSLMARKPQATKPVRDEGTTPERRPGSAPVPNRTEVPAGAE